MPAIWCTCKKPEPEWAANEESIECSSGELCTGGRWFHFKCLIGTVERLTRTKLSKSKQAEYIDGWTREDEWRCDPCDVLHASAQAPKKRRKQKA